MTNPAFNATSTRASEIPNREGEIREIAQAVRDLLQQNESALLLQCAVSVAQGNVLEAFTPPRYLGQSNRNDDDGATF